MHGAVPYSIVGVREAIIRAARVPKELIHSALISGRHPPTLRMHTNLLARGRALPSYTARALPSDDQCQKKKKNVLKGLEY